MDKDYNNGDSNMIKSTESEMEIYNNNQKELVLQQLNQKGARILKENFFLQDVNELMRHDTKFRNFYDKYFKDSSDVKTAILYLKIYETLEKEYLERNSKAIDENILVYMMTELMKNESSRKKMLSSFDDYFSGGPSNISSKKRYLLDIVAAAPTISVRERMQNQIEN